MGGLDDDDDDLFETSSFASATVVSTTSKQQSPQKQQSRRGRRPGVVDTAVGTGPPTTIGITTTMGNTSDTLRNFFEAATKDDQDDSSSSFFGRSFGTFGDFVAQGDEVLGDVNHPFSTILTDKEIIIITAPPCNPTKEKIGEPSSFFQRSLFEESFTGNKSDDGWGIPTMATTAAGTDPFDDGPHLNFSKPQPSPVVLDSFFDHQRNAN
jgi:hypothetical protein